MEEPAGVALTPSIAPVLLALQGRFAMVRFTLHIAYSNRLQAFIQNCGKGFIDLHKSIKL